MKALLSRVLTIAASAVMVAPVAAAITGQWDFNGDLTARIGQPIGYLDAETEAADSFGTTTTLGVANIGGEAAQVLKFPKTAPYGGYAVPVGAAGNGGGALVNQYTIILDVLFPSASAGKRRVLFDLNYAGNTQFAVQADNGIGSAASSSGNVTPDQWHRLVFAVDLSATPGRVDKYIDGVKVGTENLGGVDSAFALQDQIYFIMDDTDPSETEIGYINSLQIRDEKLTDGLIAALGTPTAAGILTGPPPNPYISSISPSPDTARIPARSSVPPNPQIRVVIEDGETKPVTSSIVLKFDDAVVTPQVTTSGTTTTITYSPPGLLQPLSVHKVALTFNDTSTPAKALGTTWDFAVGPFSPITGDVALPANTAGAPGFYARTVQGPAYIQEVNNPANLPTTILRGIQQLNGTLRGVDGQLVADQSTAGPEARGGYFVDGPLNFATDAEVGYFTGDQPFPGIPGQEGHSTQFASEFVGFIDLPAGVHKLGVTVNASRVDVNDDDNFALYVGANPRDAFAQVLGSYARSDAPAFDENSQNHNEFNFFAPTAGLYPIRLVYVQSGRQGSLELYSVDAETGERILVNDAANANALKVYRSSTSSKAGSPYIAEVSPRPGTAGNDPAQPIQVLIDDDVSQLASGSLQFRFNGALVTPTITKVGNRTTVTYQPNATRTQIANDISITYSDTATPQNQFTKLWSFTTTVNTAGTPSVVRGQWDFDAGNLNATVGRALEYFDGAGGTTQTGTKFGTTTSFGLPDIDGKPALVMEVPGQDSNSIGYKMYHGIAANGGGSLVNQYTLIMDVFLDTQDTGNAAASLIQVDSANNTGDGDLFWQGDNFGQGQGGYVGDGRFTLGAWHRVAIAVDLAASPGTITKFVDGVKQHDWRTDSVDGRRALREFAILFADGDADERRRIWVNSVQVREGKLSDAQLAALGGPSSGGIPQQLPATNVKGQWDFDRGNLAATAGRDLEYFDGAGGVTESGTKFGTTTSFGLPDIGGQPALVMEVPGQDSNAIGYRMFHGIAANGGGSLVNQYTLIMDVFLDTQDTGNAAASLIQTDSANNTGDGDLFWQGNNFGQGQGGYVGDGSFTLGAWHRVVIAVDLTTTPGTITKFVDGVKQHDWRTDSVDGRRALREFGILFADGDADERRRIWVNSVQVREGKLSDAQIALLGGPSAGGIPIATPQTNVKGQWDFDHGNLAATAGRDLEYFDGAGGVTETGTKFGTTTSFGLPDINGQPALVMEVPGQDSNAIGYKMFHSIAANGGGSFVNQYTLIMDVFLDTQDTGNAAASLIQIDSLNNTGDGDLFWQGDSFGQGQGGYVGAGFGLGMWHRVAIAVDLTTNPGTITKFLNGRKQHDWRTDSVDGRRALREFATLFADGDADERRRIWVNSVQVREGKLSDAQLAVLGGPSADGIPLDTPQTSVVGQWDFDYANLAATAGRDLEYFDGAGGLTQTGTRFERASDLGIPLLNGVNVEVMEAPGQDSNAIGYKMYTGIGANGGGSLANQYTLIMDVLLDTADTGNAAASLIQIDSQNNTGDGDLFWQGNNFGQGQGGYVGDGSFTLGAWHRIAIAVDLTTSPGTITKFVDGVKQDDWRTDTVDGRRALRDFAILFADGDADERRRLWVNSIQLHNRKLTDAELTALGGPSGDSIPLLIPTGAVVDEEPFINISLNGANVVLSWEGVGFTLEATADLSVPNWQAVAGVAGNTASLPIGAGGNRFFRLKK